MIAWGAALVFILFGVLATRRLSRALDQAVTSRTICGWCGDTAGVE
jgi:hypothetical protein